MKYLRPCEVSDFRHHIGVDEITWSLAYLRGYLKARYPVPAIPLIARWPEDGYIGMLYIDALNYGEHDPHMVCCWDFYYPNTEWWGKYQACYCDTDVDWYKKCGAWK